MDTTELIDHVRALQDKSNAYDALVEALKLQAEHFDAMSASYYRSAEEWKAEGNAAMHEWALGKGQAYGLAGSSIFNHLEENRVK